MRLSAVAMAAAMGVVPMLMPMPAAGVPFAVVVVMMVALEGVVMDERAFQEGFSRRVHISRSSGDQLNPAAFQGLLRACADSAADEDIYAVFRQQCGQSRMAGFPCIQQGLFRDGAVLRGIEGKGFCLSKMLEYRSVFCSDCNLHK